ncbi:MAG: ketoacyl-ACP synthase III [Planctomycetes bacterium]|nr:ketoacyl-ACP synthase III [Planctomycetota bacterium]MCP4770827.1 ketoacyl-ACP synthase III [Planctomycetota bacterium]MCP4860219.1 ketoacyl-ACP synthase III [Planctomycetota bacterium]
MNPSLIDVGIAGYGCSIPERSVDNNYFTRFFETSDEWIMQRTGIQARRWLKDDEKPSDMFTAASERCLEKSGVNAEDVDLIILATVSGDHLGVPATACIVQDNIGAKNAAAFDIQAACTGFLYALSVGRQFVATGAYKNVLVIGGEGLSRIIDIYDRGTSIIFGDGAGAVLLQPHETCQQGLIEDITLGADGAGAQFITRPRGGAMEQITPDILSEGTHQLRMKGREVYRFAVSRMTELMAWAMEGQDPEELSIVVPHQVNKRILETATAKLDLPPEKVYINIDKYGNTSAGSVPVALCECLDAGKIEKGKLVVMAAFGAGLTWGGARLRW